LYAFMNANRSGRAAVGMRRGLPIVCQCRDAL